MYTGELDAKQSRRRPQTIDRTVGGLLQRHPYVALTAGALLLWLLFGGVPFTRGRHEGPERSGSVISCGEARYRWRGMYDTFSPPLDVDLLVAHEDHAGGDVKHDVQVVFARNADERLDVVTEVWTTKPMRHDNFDIRWDGPSGKLTIVTKPQVGQTEQRQKCIVIKVQVLMPVSTPMRRIGLAFPEADVWVHESSWGSLPALDAQIGRGSVSAADGQRLHIGQTHIVVRDGKVSGRWLLTQAIKIDVRRGRLDLKVGYSPFSGGSEVALHVGEGDLTVKVEDLLYRGTSMKYRIDTGDLRAAHPPSFQGAVVLRADAGHLHVDAPKVEWLDRTGRGEKPAVARGLVGDAHAYHQVDARAKRGQLDFVVPKK